MAGVDRNHHWQVHLDQRQQELGALIHTSLGELRDAVARLEERTDELARQVNKQSTEARRGKGPGTDDE